MTTSSTASPWDELEDNPNTESRIIINAIKEARAQELTSVKLWGIPTQASIGILREKGYVLAFADDREAGPYALVSWAPKMITREEQITRRRQPGLQLPTAEAENSHTDNLTPEYRLMQQRERDDAQLRQTQPPPPAIHPRDCKVHKIYHGSDYHGPCPLGRQLTN
jgi:hypothetical protein